MSIERPALERALKPVTADIDKSLGRLARPFASVKSIMRL